MKFFKSIRTRLTLWYLLVMVVLLLVFSAVAYFMLDHNLYKNLDNSLRIRSIEIRTTSVFVPQTNELLLSFASNGTLIQQVGTSAIDTSKVSGLVEKALSGQNGYFDYRHYR